MMTYPKKLPSGCFTSSWNFAEMVDSGKIQQMWGCIKRPVRSSLPICTTSLDAAVNREVREMQGTGSIFQTVRATKILHGESFRLQVVDLAMCFTAQAL